MHSFMCSLLRCTCTRTVDYTCMQNPLSLFCLNQIIICSDSFVKECYTFKSSKFTIILYQICSNE